MVEYKELTGYPSIDKPWLKWMSKAIKVMETGADLMMFPEGVWNKTPNQLMLDL